MRSLPYQPISYTRSEATVFALFQPRIKSLLRGSLLSMASFTAGILLSGFPNSRPSPWIILPLLGSCWGTWETARCMKRRWDWYHGGVLFLVYADLMVIMMLLLFLVYPYAHWLTRAAW
ncbi:permease [Terriglobus tenax]|uniref:permease n=1 Tax=Terriglobus tenax TaxID=1111115 RepID=UPI0021E006AF|nr:permease [Terriglobus tenax]